MKKNIKKIIAIFLLLILTNLNFAFANDTINAVEQKTVLKDSVGCTKVNFIVPENSILKLAFAEKFNANKAIIGNKVHFLLSEDVISKNGQVLLPKDTKFIGVVEKQIKSKSFNRNARVFISIKQIELPSGELKNISAKIAQKNGELKSPFIANLPKIILEAGVIAGVGIVASTIVIAYAVASIFTGGVAVLALLPVVSAATASLGVVICTTSKGVNYKVSPGKVIPVVVQNDIELDI